MEANLYATNGSDNELEALASFMTTEYTLYGYDGSLQRQESTPKDFPFCPQGQYLSSFALVEVISPRRDLLLHRSTSTPELLSTTK